MKIVISLVSAIVSFGLFTIGPLAESALAQKSSGLYIKGEAPVIDGDLAEWKQEFLKVPKENWYYAISYDEQAIYVAMAILDAEAQYQILMCGLTCWVIEKGGKKNRKGLRFPRGLPEKQQPSDTESLMWYLEELAANKQEAILAVEGMELINFYGKQEANWGKNLREDGLQAQLGMNAEGDMLYELRLPRDLFAAFWEQQSRNFSLMWETGALGRPKDIAGRDVIGISGGSTSNPRIYDGETVRNIHARQDQYRAYAKPRRFHLKKLKLTSKK